MNGQQHAPAELYPEERPGTNFTGGWVGPKAGLDGRKISSHRDSIPDRPARSSVAIQTELLGPLFLKIPSVYNGIETLPKSYESLVILKF